ncbi:MAG TPA: tyrosine--tRNA ligase, partial [Treponemataceae bacterium]|nr:tyrosine--tRNA ligase [Treponemataceae bacterium]
NITAGIDLIRRKRGPEAKAFGLTFPLVSRSDGKKMGKTEKGALFIDPEITPVFDFFQYWRNVADEDVRKFFLLFSFLPVEEVDAICKGDINKAKERLAYEVTKEIHGKGDSEKALAGAKAAFNGIGDKTAMPTAEISKAELDAGISIIDLFTIVNLGGSKSDIRRLIQGGGARINDEKIIDLKMLVNSNMVDEDGEIILRAGKKKFCRIVLV